MGSLACPGDDTLPVSDLFLLAAIALLPYSVVWLVLVLRTRRADLPAVARALASVRVIAVSFGRRSSEERSVSPD